MAEIIMNLQSTTYVTMLLGFLLNSAEIWGTEMVLPLLQSKTHNQV